MLKILFLVLLAGSITFTFFVSFFINMGMVTGILPVVGIPLPLSQLWWIIHGDDDGKFRYPDVYTNT